MPKVGETEDDDGVKLVCPGVEGELHVCDVKDEGGRGVGSGERWEWGGVTRLGSI